MKSNERRQKESDCWWNVSMLSIASHNWSVSTRLLENCLCPFCWKCQCLHPHPNNDGLWQGVERHFTFVSFNKLLILFFFAWNNVLKSSQLEDSESLKQMTIECWFIQKTRVETKAALLNEVKQSHFNRSKCVGHPEDTAVKQIKSEVNWVWWKQKWKVSSSLKSLH